MFYMVTLLRELHKLLRKEEVVSEELEEQALVFVVLVLPVYIYHPDKSVVSVDLNAVQHMHRCWFHFSTHNVMFLIS